MNPSETIGDFPVISNFNPLFLQLNWIICNFALDLPKHCSRYINLLSRIKVRNLLVGIPPFELLDWAFTGILHNNQGSTNSGLAAYGIFTRK